MDRKLRNAGGGRSTTECRDPFSYVTPNEPMRYIWATYSTISAEVMRGLALIKIMILSP